MRSSTTSGGLQVNLSSDGGANWTAATGSPISGIGTSFTLYEITVNDATIDKVQFRRTAATIYIDDITITAGGPILAAPTVTSGSAGSIATTSATISGNSVDDDGGATITERGVAYATTTSPTTGDSTVTSAGTTGSYDVNLTSLSVNTRYYFRAYASNSEGTSYGSESSFWTLANTPAAPTVGNAAASSLDITINANGNPATTTYAIQRTSDSQYVQANGSFGASAVWQTAATWGNKTVIGLTAETTYTFQVKARNGDNVETAFSATADGTTLAAGAQLTTTVPSTITASSASSGGNITSQGDSAVTQRGVAYGTVSGPTIVEDSFTSDGSGTGAFSSSLSGLIANTKYYVRAYAVNSEGTYYGNQVSFTTECFSATVIGLNVSATNSYDFTATWSALAGASSYRVDVSTLDTFGVLTGSTNTIYSEDFSDAALDGKGASGGSTAGVTTNMSGVTSFTIEADSAVFTTDSSGNSFQVANAQFEGNDVDGTATWRSRSIDVSSISSVDASLLFKVRGAGDNSSADFGFEWGYELDGGALVKVNDIGDQAGEENQTTLNNTTLSVSGVDVSGATGIVIRVDMGANGGSDGFAFDDVLVESIIEPAPLYQAGYSNRTVTGATSLSVTGLSENVAYYFRVRGVGGGSCVSDNSSTVSVTTVFQSTDPPAIGAASSVQTTSFTANWSASDNATGYALDVSTGSSFASYVSGYEDRDVGNVTSFAVTNLSPATPYYYRVRALRGGVASGNSSTQTVTTAVGAPEVGSPVVVSSATNSAVIGGTVTATNGGSILAHGVFWSTDDGFDVASATRVDDNPAFTGTGAFSVPVGSLPSGTLIYLRAYARNSGGTGTTDQISFTTQVGAVTALDADNITPSAFSANWEAQTGATNYLLDVATDDAFVSFVSGYEARVVGDVTTFSVTNLATAVTYYYRVRAESGQGIGANSQTITAETGSVEPTVVSFAASNITYTAATVGGEVTSTGGATVTNRGVVYATSPTPTLADTVEASGTGLGAYTIELTGLTPGQTYYARAFAQNQNGTAYGDEITFATTTPTAPSVTTLSADATGPLSGVVTGEVTEANGAAVTNRGIVWSTGATPTLANSSATSGSGTGVFDAVVSSLTPGQTYYARAFAQNSAGTGYGDAVSFTADCFDSVVTGLSVTDTNNADFTLIWSALTGASGYRLDVATNSVFESVGGGSSEVWINEIHYDDASTDSGEGAEVAGPAGTDLSGYTLLAYNGGNGAVYQTVSLSGTIDDEGSGYGALWFDMVGLQNGAPDGIALVNSSGVLVKFISYEGSFAAVDGAATGVTSTDIGVSESGSVEGQSLQLTGTGSAYSDFTWAAESTASPGTLNAGQTAAGSSSSSYLPGYSNLTVAGTSAVVTGLTDNTAYFFRVRAAGGGDCVSANSSTGSVTTTLGAPSAPVTAVATNVGSYSFFANWSASANSTSYRLDVATASDFSAYVAGYQDRNVGDVTTFSVTGLTPIVSYYYRVRAVNGSGTSDNSDTQSVTTVATAPTISTPSSADVTVSTATLGATIDNTNGASVVEWGVYWSTTSGFTPPGAGTAVTETGTRGEGAFTVAATGLPSGRTVYFRGYAVNSGGTNYTAQSSFLTAPAAPAIAAASDVLSRSFSANWSAATGATNYFIDVSESDTFASYVSGYENLVAGNVTTISVTGLSASVTYYYRVRAQNASGTSTNSANGSATPQADAPTVTTEPVTAITQSGATSGGEVTADGGLSVTNRGVVWGTSSNPTVALATKTSDGSGTGAFVSTLTGLTPGQTYYVRAYAQNASGTGYGANETFTAECLTNVTASLYASATNSTSFTAAWSAVSGASGYRLDVSTISDFVTAGNASSIFFSEYAEGTGNNKYLELFNGTGSDIDLSTYEILFFFNGGTTPSAQLTLSGTLTNGGVFVIENSSEALGVTADLASSSLSFNGDDAIALTNTLGGGYVDVIGQIGVDPGTAWGSGDTSTSDRTLRRKATVFAGDSNDGDAFDPSVEWDGYALESTDGYGSHAFTAPDVYGYVAGYSNRVVSGTSHTVTGLTEGVEHFFRLRATAAGGCAGPNSSTASVTTIVVTPAISFASASASNKDETNAAFTVNIQLAVAANASVEIESVGSATLDSDFTLSATQFVFTAEGATTQTLTITPIDDTEFESPEEISLNLINITGAEAGTYTNFTAALLDIEPTVSFSIGFVTVAEDAGTYQFNVEKSYPVNDVSGSFNLYGSAVEGTDYSIDGTNFTLNGATTSATFTVTITNNAAADFDRFIGFSLTNLTQAATGSTASITITDDGDGDAINPGDLAIIGFHSDEPDDFMIVALTNLPGSTMVKFTDTGVNGGALVDGETTFSWITPSGGVPAGTLVAFSNNATATTGTVDGALTGLSTGGDQILAYQGTLASPTFIYAINFEDSTWQNPYANTADSELPPGLTNGLTAVALVENDNGVYNGTASGDQATLLLAIGNPANWTMSATRTAVVFPQSDFSITGPQPEIAVLGTNGNAIASGTLTTSSALGTDFGTIDVNLTVERTFTVTNSGSVALTISDVSVSGTHASDFSIQTAPAGTVASLEATTFTVLFDPVSSGIRTAVVTIANSDDDEGAYTFTVRGTAQGPTASFGFSSTNVEENAGAIAVPVNLAYAADSTVRVAVVSGGTATLNSDYTLSTTQLVFTAGGSTSQTLSVTITDDSLYEEQETFTLRLVNFSNASGGTPTNVTFTINFNDAMTPLAPGDLAIIGRHTSDNSFSLLALTNIAAGHVVYFTDSGWIDSTSSFRANEGLMKITFNSEIAAGTIIRTTDTGAGWTWTTSGSAPVSGSLSTPALASAGDQIYAFQVAYATNTVYLSDKTFVYVFDDTGVFEDATTSNEGNIPPGLSAESDTAVTLDLAGDTPVGLNMDYVETNSFDKAGWLAYINNIDNWTITAATIPSGSLPFGTPPAAPSAPTVLAADQVSKTSFRARWSLADRAYSYRLDVSTVSNFTSYLSGYENLKLGSNVTTRTVSDLTAGNTYYYRVRAINPGGASADSSVQEVQTTPPAVPPVPTLSTPSLVSSNQFRVNWAAAGDATSYLLDVNSSSNFGAGTAIGLYDAYEVAVTYQLITGLTAGQTYYYRVAARNADGDSAYSSAGEVTLPDSIYIQPVADAPQVGENQATLSWTATPNSSYNIYISGSDPDDAGGWSFDQSSRPGSGSASATVTENEYRTFYRVVVEGTGQDGANSDNPVFGIVKPLIPSGYSLMSPPLTGNRAFNGSFGTNLAVGLTGGTLASPNDRVLIRDGAGWRTIYLESGSGQWYEGASPSTYELAEGEGFYIYRSGAPVRPRFTGYVGNQGITNVAINTSWNIIGPSQGKDVGVSELTFDGTPSLGSRPSQATYDRIVVLVDGAWRTFSRFNHNGSPAWLDSVTGLPAEFDIQPGVGVYYYRYGGDPLKVNF